jgi:hypothetical protein
MYRNGSAHALSTAGTIVPPLSFFNMLACGQLHGAIAIEAGEDGGAFAIKKRPPKQKVGGLFRISSFKFIGR